MGEGMEGGGREMNRPWSLPSRNSQSVGEVRPVIVTSAPTTSGIYQELTLWPLCYRLMFSLFVNLHKGHWLL